MGQVKERAVKDFQVPFWLNAVGVREEKGTEADFRTLNADREVEKT